MIKLSDYVIKFIEKQKIKHVFLLPGGGCMHLVDSLGNNKKIKHTCNLHEQACAVCADAYAQYTGKLGIALVTTGPGSTNALTGVAASWIDSTPVLFLSGQVKRADLIGKSGVRQMGVQEVDIIPMAKPVTKYAVTVMDPDLIRYHLEKAVYLAKSGRPGPVWITIPLDVQASMINVKKLKGFYTPRIKQNDISKQIKKTVELINNSKRPVILAGNGIRLSGAKEAFLKLIRKLNIPVLTTWRADDFLPENDPLYFGRPGVVGQRGANFIQQNSDLIITIGARLDMGQIGFDHKNFARAAKKVVVDIDPAEIKKLKIRVDVPVVSDAKAFISQLQKSISDLIIKDRTVWITTCSNWKQRYPVVDSKNYRNSGNVNTYVFIDALSDVMKQNDVLVPGSSGSCAEITQQALRIKKGLRVLNTPGLGSMGFGLPASIGACIASGGKRTITVIGDGGLQHNIQELETLSRLKLPVKVFVLNNNGYASIKATQKRYFKGHLVCCDPKSGLTFPDTQKISSAYGIKSFELTNQRDIKRQLKKILNTKGPVICEVMIDPKQETSPRISSYIKADGSMASKPLEDLWPFLPRDEFRDNMIIKPLEE